MMNFELNLSGDINLGENVKMKSIGVEEATRIWKCVCHWS